MLRLPVALQVPLAGSYSSALLRSAERAAGHAATSTLPLGNKVAVCAARSVLRLPVARQVSLGSNAAVWYPRAMLRLLFALQLALAGSYCSALLREPPPVPAPAATSTLPLGNKVAVCAPRSVLRLPVALHVPLAGSYSSALL